MGLRRVLLLLTLLAATACAADSTYGSDRLADLGDIIDLKYGLSMGLGIKLEATQFLGAGLGFGGQGAYETYGRDEEEVEGLFLHLVIIGMDGAPIACGSSEHVEADILGVNVPAFRFREPPRAINRFRFGGELLLPCVTGGIYLNVGQLVDGVAGIVTFDPAGDDQATERERERQRAEALRADASHPPLPDQD